MKNSNDIDEDIEVKAMQLALEDCRKAGYLLDYLDREEFKVMATKEFTVKDYVELKVEEAREKAEEEAKQKIKEERQKAEEERQKAEEAKQKIIRSMISKGLSLKEISDFTGMPESEINDLIK